MRPGEAIGMTHEHAILKARALKREYGRKATNIQIHWDQSCQQWCVVWLWNRRFQNVEQEYHGGSGVASGGE